jgi:hypothetical protein
VPLVVKMTEGKEGNYTLRTKIRKEGRVTTYDKSASIILKFSGLSAKIEKTVLKNSSAALKAKQNKLLNKNSSAENVSFKHTSKKSSRVAYESDTYMIKKLLPLLVAIIFLFSVVVGLVIFKDRG